MSFIAVAESGEELWQRTHWRRLSKYWICGCAVDGQVAGASSAEYKRLTPLTWGSQHCQEAFHTQPPPEVFTVILTLLAIVSGYVVVSA